MPLLIAATFNDRLFEAVGNVIGIEGRAFGNSGFSGIDYWTPNVNPFKDPRWGRGSETPGEDILLIKRYAASMIRGLEGDKAQRRVVATCKHFAGNDFEDWNGSNRHNFNADVSLQDLAEYYMMPFQQCARDSKVGSIMCAYNAVNGVPSCANSYLMDTILRKHWNWTDHNNYITSDCEAVLDVSANHRYAKTNAAGTAMCFDAGMDTSCEYSGSSDIPGAWKQGLLKQATVDKALRRLYEGLIRAGYFDGENGVYASLGWSDVNKPESQQIALQSALEGIVLLKNDRTLPLNLNTSSKVAMVGFWADAADKLSGGYSGTPAYLRSPAYVAREMGLNITTAPGPILQSNSVNDSWTTRAVKVAGDADYILYFGGLDTSAAGETKDRLTIEWPAAQITLIKRLAQLGKPLVVVQLGDQVDDTPLLEIKGVNSILWANWPGQEGGRAVMQLILGAKAPAGRLPVTQYPANYTSLIGMTNVGLRASGSSPGRTYRWYSTAVKPFGFGLHYTTFNPQFGSFAKSFSINDLVRNCTKTYLDTCALPSLPVEVTNKGNRTSDYVVLAFVSGEYGPRPYPIKTLAAYTRINNISPGNNVTVNLEWTVGNLARHDENGNTVIYPGKYTLTLDEPALVNMTFILEGEPLVLDKWPKPPN
jgi:xylan 1,4-beta-xylosidase